MALKLKYNESTLSKKLDNMSEKLGAVLLMYSATKASRIAATMKQNRLWRDRTGIAKGMLNAKVSQPNPFTIRITLLHGVEYGIWLELANEKKYAIIGPTIVAEAPGIVKDLGNLMSKLK